jgi:glycosyltransferase involved in cell wall biosynthesis
MNAENILFSVIIPIYNVESYLNECLESVVSQTYKNIEVILIDDGSTDNSAKICYSYSQKDVRITMIQQSNKGLSIARNTGIRASKGQYLVFIDSDDFLTDINALMNLYTVIIETNYNVIYNCYLTSFTDGEKNISINEGFNNIYECYAKNFYSNNQGAVIPVVSFVINHEHILKYNLFFTEGVLHEDLEWIPHVICSTNIIGINHHPFYTYRRNRKGSITSTVNPKREISKLLIIENLINTMKSEKKDI